MLQNHTESIRFRDVPFIARCFVAVGFITNLLHVFYPACKVWKVIVRVLTDDLYTFAFNSFQKPDFGVVSMMDFLTFNMLDEIG